MAKAYDSLLFNSSAGDVWAVIRPFDHYAWAGVEGETPIEDGKAGDQVPAVRRIGAGDKAFRQKLLAPSDLERSYTYAFCEPAPFPVRNYVATIRVSPVVETGDAFVEWQATFDAPADEIERWTHFFERDGFAKWLTALRSYCERRGRAASA